MLLLAVTSTLGHLMFRDADQAQVQTIDLHNLQTMNFILQEYNGSKLTSHTI